MDTAQTASKKHAVPQNIMDVEFKLFGSLTFRQFAYIASTFIVALVIYTTLPQLAAIPVIFFVVLIGFALALLRVNEQPFSVWLGNFVRSMFTSQRKVYQKSAKSSKYLAPVKGTSVKSAAKMAEEVRSATAARDLVTQSVTSFVRREAEEESVPDKVDDILTGDAVSRLDRYFETAVSGNLNKYNLKPAGGALAGEETVPSNRTLQSDTSNVAVDAVRGSLPRPFNPSSVAADVQAVRPPGNAQLRQAEPVPINQEEEPVVEQASAEALETTESHVETVDEAVSEEAGPNVAPATPPSPVPPPQPTPTPEVSTSSGENSGSDVAASSDDSGLRVMRRLRPNQIAGFIVGKDSQPLARAEVFVKNEKSELLRSAYSDVHGKFIVPSPLPSGKYQLEIKAKGHKFPEYELELKGELLPMYRYLASE